MAGLPEALVEAARSATGRAPRAASPLSGGCLAQVLKLELEGGGAVVAKLDPNGGLEPEAWMLRYLAERSRLPVPAVLHAAPDLLLMEHIETAGGLTASAECHAAELIADLHGIEGAAFGLERDTVIGTLPQPNGPMEDWVGFLRERRLLHMGRVARERGHLPAGTFRALEDFCETKLEGYLDSDQRPVLLHGDLWGGNVLCNRGRIAGFIDPAVYYGHPEIELAFSTLFGTFGEAFFSRYQEIRPLEPGFFEARRDLYNLYPLLVHTALFGGGYAGSVAATLQRYD